MKKPPRLLTYPLAAIMLLGVALSAHANGNSCAFKARGLSMSFGVLNPASGSNVTVAASASTLDANKAGDCAPGQTMVISGDNGVSYNNGSRQLRNAAGTDFIAYSLSLPPNSSGPGNGVYTNFTISGTILWSAYANASAGNYTDNVIISVNP